MNDLTSLSPKEYEILQLLIEHGELYGLDMIKRSKALKRGSIYVLLSRMSDKGFVESRLSKEPSGGPPRRRYKATALGNRAASAYEAAKAVMSGNLGWGAV